MDEVSKIDIEIAFLKEQLKEKETLRSQLVGGVKGKASPSKRHKYLRLIEAGS